MTELLFLRDAYLREFDATVLDVREDSVVLDRTAFYARSGGQEPDLGSIAGIEVADVGKYGQVIVHELKSPGPRPGEEVQCTVDAERRGILMRHHTATHVLNGAARKLLGSWVWQHSAYKDLDKARLDITHHAHLSREEVQTLEDMANDVVLRNLPVLKEVLPRGVAEAKYGFQIYQGGVVPGGEVRIQNILDWDVEACGGTHCSRTGEIGLIKILKTERIQDGIERLEFVAGKAALKHVQSQAQTVAEVGQQLGAPPDKITAAVVNNLQQLDGLRKQQKALLRRASQSLTAEIVDSAPSIDGIKMHISEDQDLGDEIHIGIAEQAVTRNPELIYSAFLLRDGRIRILIFSGKEAQKRGLHAGSLTREVAKLIGGSGGGDPGFGQGGGTLLEHLDEAKKSLEALVRKAVEARH